MFLAHINDVAPGFKKPLLQYSRKKLLANNNGTFTLANNICPHQGSLILSDTAEQYRCQYHGWTWDNTGAATGNGYTSVCNKFEMVQRPTCIHNGLIFSEDIDLPELGIDLSFMQLESQRVDTVNTSYKNIMDVFLDVDHIPVVHRDLYPEIGIETSADVEWSYHKWGSVQIVRKSTEPGAEFKATLLGNETLAAVWIAVYPYTMIEWQPGAMFVTVSSQSTDVAVFKYRDRRYSDRNWELNSHIWETAWAQDQHQSQEIVSTCEFTPHLEQAKIHFREYIKAQYESRF